MAKCFSVLELLHLGLGGLLVLAGSVCSIPLRHRLYWTPSSGRIRCPRKKSTLQAVSWLLSLPDNIRTHEKHSPWDGDMAGLELWAVTAIRTWRMLTRGAKEKQAASLTNGQGYFIRPRLQFCNPPAQQLFPQTTGQPWLDMALLDTTDD